MKKGLKIGLITGGALITIGLVAAIAGGKFKSAKYQDDAHAKELDSTANDKIEVRNMTTEEVVDMVEKVSNGASAQAISEMTAQVPSVNTTAYMVSIVSTAKYADEAVVLLDLYSDSHRAWVDRALDASYDVGLQVSNVLASSAEGLRTKCTCTTFVDNVTETSEGTTVVHNTSKRAFLSVCRKNSSEKITTERNTVSHVMVPHCTDTAIDPTEYAARLGAARLAVEAAYAGYKRILQSEPDVADFYTYIETYGLEGARAFVGKL